MVLTAFRCIFLNPLLLALALTLETPIALCTQGGLAHQIAQFAHTEGFKVRGIDQLGNAPAGRAKGSPLQQMRTLLENFDYVIVHGASGKVQRLIIVGHKQPAPPPIESPSQATYQQPASQPIAGSHGGEAIIHTRRDGSNHIIAATLVGTNGQRIAIEMLIDTHSSMTVLPKSQASALGLVMDRHPVKKLKTAQGQLQVRAGILPTLELGPIQVSNLDVAFAENSSLGELGILGMNLLSRYIFILDDEHNELTLVPDPH